MSGSSRARTVRGREHEVTLSVSFIQAVDPPEREPQFYESIRDGQRKRIYESLNPGHHFHLEYCPLPGERGGKTYHTDVVTFGVASKVYTDQDVRVVRCWGDKKEEEGEEEEGKEEGEKLVHFGWRHRHTFKVTRPLLLELYDHVMEVRVWNTKDKLSARAQYDRPKVFRLPAPSKRPQQGEEDLPTTGQPARLPVVSQDHVRASRKGRRGGRRSNLNVATAETDSDDPNVSIGEVASPLVSPRKASTIVEEGEVEGKEEGGGGGIAEGVKEEGGGGEGVKEEGGGGTTSLSVALIPHSDHNLPTSSMQLATTPVSTTLLSTTLQGLSRHKVKRLEAEAAEQARVAREGVAVLRLRMSDLFAKRTSISATIGQAVKDLKGFEVVVSLEGPLMPEYLLWELNPMTITVNSASGLPSTPIPHQELSERCEPVYVKYRFFSQPWHHTSSLPHSPRITWEDSHVILLGTIERELLVEYLRGPPLVMELHDRDCRQGDPPLPSLFGREERDEVLGTHAFGTGLPKKSCGSDGRSRDPCGIARVDLSGLLDGQRMVEVTVPIINSSFLGGEEEEEGGVRVGPLGRVLLDPLPPGDYIQSQSELTVTVELTHALTTSLPSPSHTLHSMPTKKPEQPQRTPKPSVCPFNRLVYVISSEGKPLVERILTLVNEVNTRALGLQDLPSNVLPAALSTYKLTKDQMCCVGCDVITGFHVEDWDQHVVMLEGVREGGVRRVWEELPHHPTQAEGLLKVFYNSDFAFSHRLYGSLDVDLPRVLLHQPLRELLQQSVLYVRGSIPRRCFYALVRLSELAVVSEMGELTRNELFPTAEEVAALGLQFAVPPTFETEEECIASPLESSLERPRTPPLEERHRLHRGSQRVWEPLDLSNAVFERVLRERGSAPTQDFIRRNILHSQALSEWSAQRRALRRTQSVTESGLSQRRMRSLSEGALSHKKLESPVHNYSTQTLNSTELAKAMLREQLARDPAHRHTYCQQYHSMTVVPIDVEAEQRAKRLEARQKWRTKEGFVYPGVPTSAESSSHPRKPDPARVEDLKEPFMDNLLHANTLKPTVERLHFSWQKRSADFERWKPPPASLGPAPPPTIHLAGESRARELRQSQERDKEEWRRRLVVADTCFHIHRKGISTELHSSGPKASTQVDKLGGLLKDTPQKHSLREEGLRLDSVAALDVVHNPSVDSRLNVLCVEGEREEEGAGGAYLPGPFNARSLKLGGNIIPVHVQRGIQLNKRGDVTHRKPPTQDFRLYYHTSTVASKRPILPLREDEKALPLFTAQTRPPPPPLPLI